MAFFLSPLTSVAAINSINERIFQRERRFLSREDATTLDDKEFISLFRLDKDSFLELCTALRPKLEGISDRGNIMTVETKVLCALRFFGTGSYQKSVSNDRYLSLSQSSASRAISQVSEAANELLLEKWVKYPTSRKELQDVKQGFNDFCKIPGVVGAIDCTHVAIVAPKENENNFVCRKGYHSLNVQLVCDAKMRILNVNARFPGSSHDSFIWKSSALRRAFSEGHIPPDSYLLGDQGYALEPWLMTPVNNAQCGTAEDHYNTLHSYGRNVIERCNGLLKSRFRCLLRHRTLHYTPVAAGKIINTCVILHNICLDKGIPLLGSDSSDVAPSNNGTYLSSNMPSNITLYNAGKRVRQNLIHILSNQQ